ncbi:hypothetical protein [Parasphingorhabdus pacifica]
MSTSGGENPERVLSAALRAQAAGGGVPQPTSTGDRTAREPQERRSGRIPVARVLLAAVLLGVAAGMLAGFFSLTGLPLP